MRFISPSFLTLTILMAFMPWVEVRCDRGGPGPFRLSRVVVDQDAFQMATGKVHFTPAPTLGGNLGQPQAPAPKFRPEEQNTKTPAAPLIWAVLGCALLGAIVGFAVPARKPRLLLTLLAALGAGGAMLAQALMGFPLIEQATTKGIEQFMDKNDLNDPQLHMPGDVWTTGFTSSFHLAVAGLAGGLIGVLVDFLNPPKRRREDEEDEDRPVRRARRLREVDEDDPPRRSRRDEEDEPPRRSRRDEDEDDRPPSRPGDDRFRR